MRGCPLFRKFFITHVLPSVFEYTGLVVIVSGAQGIQLNLCTLYNLSCRMAWRHIRAFWSIPIWRLPIHNLHSRWVSILPPPPYRYGLCGHMVSILGYNVKVPPHTNHKLPTRNIMFGCPLIRFLSPLLSLSLSPSLPPSPPSLPPSLPPSRYPHLQPMVRFHSRIFHPYVHASNG